MKTVDGIPDFWFKAIKNNNMIFELVKEKDEEILKNIRYIDSERTSSPKTLTVRFYFNDNEFFENKDLSLKIYYRGDEDDVEKIEGSEIKWNEAKDPTKKKVKKKQKHKKTNETRTIVKTVEADSFFNVFTSRTAPDEQSNIESEEENDLQDKIDQAMNLAEDIEDVLIPDALEYYLGINDDLYEGFDDEGDEDSEGEGGDGDSDDDKKKAPKKKGGKGDKKEGGPAAAGGEPQ